MVQGDADDKESLIRAFQGAHAIYSNVDFFTHLFHALGQPDIIPAGKNALTHAYDREVEQGVNIAEAAEDPSVLKTLERFIVSALSNATKWSGGKYTTVYHFDSKTEILRQARERCPGVAAKISTVQMGHYVENWRAVAKMAPQKQADGSFLLSRPSPPTYKMPLVVAERDAGAFAKALVVDLPVGKNLMGVSEWMTFDEYAELWGRVNGVKTNYKTISKEEFFEGVPDILAKELGDSFDYIEEFGFTGGDPDVLSPEQVRR